MTAAEGGARTGENATVEWGQGHPEWCPNGKPDDESHCSHWWDHEPCCRCGDNTCADPFCEHPGCGNGHCLHAHPDDTGSFCCCRCARRSVNLPGLGAAERFQVPCENDVPRLTRWFRHHTRGWMLGMLPTAPPGRQVEG